MQTILIVEDDLVLQDNLNELLIGNGYKTCVAGNGLEAIAKLKTSKVDLILSDISMPQMDGYQFMEEIRFRQDISGVPILFLSAKSDLEDMRKGMNLGADDYIFKPYNSDDLLKSIKVRLKKRKLLQSSYHDLRHAILNKLPHELRTPLIPILGYTDLIKENLESIDGEELESIAVSIHSSADRLLSMINKFLFYAEIEDLYENDQALENLGENFCEIDSSLFLDNFRKKLDEYGRLDDIFLEIEPSELKMNKNFLIKSISELLENAVKYSGKNTPIYIRGRRDVNDYTISILDHGCGIKEEDLNKLRSFAKFNENMNADPGIGIGLTLVRRALEMFNGSFTIDSIFGELTTVTIMLPVVD
ncbi:MAG: response regulator [Melioribacteraceae bacterium]|nr:response regulator [Melioribacteraceae bacterium]